MMINKVDIILPVYNSKKYILNTLNSIIKQSYKFWNLIIVDDHSNDGTYEIIKEFKNKNFNNEKIFLYRTSKNKGQAFARNLALKKTRSSFVAFIDSDDIWEKNKLKHQIKFMLNNNYNFTYTDYKTFKNYKKKIIKVSKSYNYKSFIRDTSIATSTMIIKKKIINNISFPSLRLCEDYYFKCKILKKVKAYKCPQIYSHYIIRNNSLQNRRIRVLLAVWNINKNFNKMNFIDNIISIFFISLNSLKKYGFR